MNSVLLVKESASSSSAHLRLYGLFELSAPATGFLDGVTQPGRAELGSSFSVRRLEPHRRLEGRDDPLGRASAALVLQCIGELAVRAAIRRRDIERSAEGGSGVRVARRVRVPAAHGPQRASIVELRIVVGRTHGRGLAQQGGGTLELRALGATAILAFEQRQPELAGGVVVRTTSMRPRKLIGLGSFRVAAQRRESAASAYVGLGEGR